MTIVRLGIVVSESWCEILEITPEEPRNDSHCSLIYSLEECNEQRELVRSDCHYL